MQTATTVTRINTMNQTNSNPRGAAIVHFLGAARHYLASADFRAYTLRLLLVTIIVCAFCVPVVGAILGAVIR